MLMLVIRRSIFQGGFSRHRMGMLLLPLGVESSARCAASARGGRKLLTKRSCSPNALLCGFSCLLTIASGTVIDLDRKSKSFESCFIMHKNYGFHAQVVGSSKRWPGLFEGSERPIWLRLYCNSSRDFITFIGRPHPFSSEVETSHRLISNVGSTKCICHVYSH